MNVRYSHYKRLVPGVIFFITLSLGNAIANDSDFIMDTEPDRQFFMSTFNDCTECSTLTVVVSSKKVDDKARDIFKFISERWGGKHAGAILDKDAVWKHYRIFNGYGCGRLDKHGENFVVYVDRNEQYCGVFPFTSPTQINSIVQIIDSNLDDAAKIGVERWTELVMNGYDEYARDNPAFKAMRGPVVEFVHYVTGYIKKYDE